MKTADINTSVIKTAEEIISEIRGSRVSTRQIEPF